jgi:hypothetical protein
VAGSKLISICFILTLQPVILFTMPCWDDHHYSNSFDVFIRGNSITFPARFLPLLPQYRLL